MLIAQISDLHVHGRGERISGLVDANENLARAIEYLNAMEPRPDAVVATGDLTDNGTPEQYAILRELLDGLDAPLYLVPGNHDERRPLADAFPHHTYLPRDGGPQSYAIEDHAVRLVGVDTTHPGHHDGELGTDELAWLDETLAARPDAPTLVFMHHPPFDTGIWWMDCVGISDEHRRGFEAVIRRHPQVQRVVSGHIHRPVQTAWGATIVSVAPSTAHQVGLDLVAGGGMRLTDEPPMVTFIDWTDDHVLNHTAAFLPNASFDIGEQMPEEAKTAILERPPAVKGGAFN
jgi:Icc protein